MRYEICPADIIYAFGAYGMPTRFTHWSFGKQFHKMKLHYDLGLSQIYDLVINSYPCYEFLLDTYRLLLYILIIVINIDLNYLLYINIIKYIKYYSKL